MSLLTDIFSSPFKLYASKSFTNPIPTLKVKFKTDDIHDSSTKEEIFILSKMYFDNIVSQYKNYSIGGIPTTESSYRLYAGIVEEDDLEQKHIYSIAYDNIADKISWENKYDDDSTIEGDFYIGLDVSACVIDDYEDENEEEPTPPKKAITENECIICLENKPNILYTECLHIVVCVSCDSKGEFSKCPMCRTKIKNQRIKIF